MKMPSKQFAFNQEIDVNQSEINSKKVLIVEGKDEVFFFESLFKFMNIEESIQILELGGVDNMKTKIKTIKNMPNFDEVDSIGIVRDSDGSIKSALQSVQNILSDTDLPVPVSHNSFTKADSLLKLGVFIMPGEEIEGAMLEDLCLHTKSEDENINLINEYLNQLKESGSSYPSNVAKAKVLIYLASANKVVNTLGLGAKKGYWNLSSEALNPIKSFITNL
ncbi:DUF3226 domain-containing protein [Planococcus donghaensis]|uniref:DUF3226 domain-containing protein n=1 Tax=Planococcus donghaensis TaxID=414778 RepID=UPI003736C57E